MKTRKILTIIGTRPEAIKLAPVVAALKKRPDSFLSRVCATGQHRDLMDQALATFDVRPDVDLDLMARDQSLAAVTSRAVAALDTVMTHEAPDLVLVQGDTTSAFCGALAAYYHRIPVGHVEAGLRTNDKYAPFPEEINRRMIGRIADLHFAPTSSARAALLHEGIPEAAIHVTGNTVIDALLEARDRVRAQKPELPASLEALPAGHDIVLVTGHRRESFGKDFEAICHAIRSVADALDNVAFVYPVHLNPHVREPVMRILGDHPRIHLIEPLTYLPFVWLMDRSCVVLTDSGGVQEEAPSLGKPVLVMRRTTERPEGIAAGNALLVGVAEADIAAALLRLLRNADTRAQMALVQNPYGDGHAARRIVSIVADFWKA